MTSSPKISIGIPTYNGARRITTALESIFSQLDPALGEVIEVVISDNASADETEAIALSYIQRFPCKVSYYKNDVNIGYDRNVNSIFLRANGDFVWLLSDDDSLKPGAIIEVLGIISSFSDLKLIQMNFQSYDSSLKQLVHEIKMPEDLYCDNPTEFLEKSEGRYGQVSSLIFNRQSWNESNVENVFGSNYVHIYALLKVLLMGHSYICKEPLVNVRLGSENFGVTGDALILTPLGAGGIFMKMPEIGYGADISNMLLRDNRSYVFSIIPHAKFMGIKRPLALIKKLFKVHNSIQLWVLWVPLLLCPTPLYRYLYRSLKSLARWFK
jgi:abequosyltransferase